MLKLNRQNVVATLYPERIIQFGDGNFLRGFIEWIVWNMNKTVDFNSGIVVVKAREHGSVESLNAQDGLYYLNLQGLEKGKKVDALELMDVICRGLNPYTDFEAYLQLAENPDMRFVVSNTTEAGIVFDDGC
jgi:tagaturonate reductase